MYGFVEENIFSGIEISGRSKRNEGNDKGKREKQL